MSLSGNVIKGYWLRDQIATGGFGAVYLATQPIVGREVAIKIILPQYANQPDFVRRFEAEAQLIARLEHPHIVPLYDYWRSPEGAFLVMRHLRGGSLWDLLEEGPLRLERIEKFLEQICEALHTAHQAGVIHRDIKTENILLDEQKANAFLTDFGIAKDLGKGTRATRPGIIMGSPDYIAPEQALGQVVTPQTDIYSLGVVLYELLTGVLPFPDVSASDLMMMHVHEPLPPLQKARPELPDTLNEIIQTATAKKPDERYADVMTFFRAFTKAYERSGETGNTPTIRSTRMRKPMIGNFTNPYKGLRAFREVDADDFFGRGAFLERVLNTLAAEGEFQNFLALVGPSGCGKTSFMRAALIPELREAAIPGSQDWFITEMTPTSEPLLQLEGALTSVAVNPFYEDMLEELQADSHGLARMLRLLMPPKTQVVLMIDHFEELFIAVEVEEIREQFLGNLYHALLDSDSRLRVVIALQAEFLETALTYPDVARLLDARTLFIQPLSPSEMREVVVSPAERVGLKVKADLIERLLHDFGKQRGVLPLLQFCLTELFENRALVEMRIENYEEIQGVKALEWRAERIYERMNPAEQEVIKHLFLRLVKFDGKYGYLLRGVSLGILLPAQQDNTMMQKVLDDFVRYRLLVIEHDRITRTPTVMIAHQALLEHWTRLTNWLLLEVGEGR